MLKLDFYLFHVVLGFLGKGSVTRVFKNPLTFNDKLDYLDSSKQSIFLMKNEFL
jgi:hypothetical protein